MTTSQQSEIVLTSPGGQTREFVLTGGTVHIGRAESNALVLLDTKVSRAHARLERGPSGWVLVDNHSANGTYVNGRRIESALLASGDQLKLGDSILRFQSTPSTAGLDATILDHPAVIDGEADLNATLSTASFSMTLSDTREPRLVVHMPGKTWEIPLDREVVTIGRDPANDVVVEHPKVSRQHARIERHADLFVVRDLGSTNGTWLGAERLTERALRDTDTLRIGPAQLVFKRGLEFQDLTAVQMPTPPGKRGRCPVVIIPGTLGSDLWQGSERVWPNVRNLFMHPELFRLPDGPPLEARTVVGELVIVPNLIKLEQYSRLGDYLVDELGYERGKDVLEFAYDWRLDMRQAARKLAEVIDGWNKVSPMTIIAHSQGCAVARYYVERLGGKNRIGRLILIGGPQYGSPNSIAYLLAATGRNPLPLGVLGMRLLKVLGTFPAIYQMLPTYPCVVDQHGDRIDMFVDEAWLPEELRPLLHDARAFWSELGGRPSVATVSIFGYGLKTMTRLQVQRDPQGQWQKVNFVSEASGDNTVPAESAVLEGSEIHPVQQQHGTLYVDNDVKMRLKLELTR